MGMNLEKDIKSNVSKLARQSSFEDAKSKTPPFFAPKTFETPKPFPSSTFFLALFFPSGSKSPSQSIFLHPVVVEKKRLIISKYLRNFKKFIVINGLAQ